MCQLLGIKIKGHWHSFDLGWRSQVLRIRDFPEVSWSAVTDRCHDFQQSQALSQKNLRRNWSLSKISTRPWRRWQCKSSSTVINCQLLHQARSLWCTPWEFITTRTSHGRTPPPTAAESIRRRVSSYLCPCVVPRVNRRYGTRFSTWKACVMWWASRKIKEWWSVGTRFQSKHWSKHGVWTRMLPYGPTKPRLPGMLITKMNPLSTRRNCITIATD